MFLKSLLVSSFFWDLFVLFVFKHFWQLNMFFHKIFFHLFSKKHVACNLKPIFLLFFKKISHLERKSLLKNAAIFLLRNLTHEDDRRVYDPAEPSYPRRRPPPPPVPRGVVHGLGVAPDKQLID